MVRINFHVSAINPAAGFQAAFAAETAWQSVILRALAEKDTQWDFRQNCGGCRAVI